MVNFFLDQINKAKEEKDAVAYYVYKARHCNHCAIWRDGTVKKGWQERRDMYMQAARKVKANKALN